MHHFKIIKLIYPHPFKLFFIAKNMTSLMSSSKRQDKTLRQYLICPLSKIFITINYTH